MLATFKPFLEDDTANEMYITGQAGTGKTTGLAELVAYCADNGIDYTVCAFTHKACGILRSKLAVGSRVQTLWSFLKKRPAINQEAQNHRHIDTQTRSGSSDKVSIIFIDEYSMVGERDLMDLRDVQDDNEDIKIVWLGDPNQLPPVGDMQSVRPHGKYAITLTKIYRQAAGNPLMNTLNQLVSFIEGATPEPLAESSNFQRGRDIVNSYSNNNDADKVMLAYTNQQVQELNAEVQGYAMPKEGDSLFSPTTKCWYTFMHWEDDVSHIMLPFGDPLALDSKYRTLEHLIKEGYRFAVVENEEGDLETYAAIFGHYRHKQQAEQLKRAAASSNAAIGKDAAKWAAQNRDSTKARNRAKAWRNFLSFNEAVICLDFAHAMTVHKSQGSTYKTVYLDTEDLAIAAEIDYLMYLKLMYVAVSRASDAVITN